MAVGGGDRGARRGWDRRSDAAGVARGTRPAPGRERGGTGRRSRTRDRQRRRAGRAHRPPALRPWTDPRRRWRGQIDDAARDPYRPRPARRLGRRDRHEGIAGVRPRARARGHRGGAAVPMLDARRAAPLEPARARQRDRAQGQADRDGAVLRAALPACRRAISADGDPGARARAPGHRRRSPVVAAMDPRRLARMLRARTVRSPSVCRTTSSRSAQTS